MATNTMKMTQGVFLMLLIFFSAAEKAIAQPDPVPNSKTLTSYSDQNDETKKQVVHTYSDGLGAEIRTMVERGEGDVVTATIRDGLGRPSRQTKPFFSLDYGHGWATRNPVTDANAYFNGVDATRPAGGGFAFDETEYFPDPSKRVRSKALPGAVYSKAGGKTYRNWYFSRVAADFIPNPTTASLDAMSISSSNPSNAQYFLEISRDPDNRFKQLLRDKFGRVIKLWSDPSPTSGDEIVSENVYDPAGRLIKQFVPGPGGAKDPTRFRTFSYSATGLLMEESHPDEGTIKYVYDRSGRLRFSQDALQRSDPDFTRFTYHRYDQHSREIEVGVVFSAEIDFMDRFTVDFADNQYFPHVTVLHSFSPKIRKFYDDTEGLWAKIGVTSQMADHFGPTQGKLVAVVAYNENGQGTIDRVAEVYCYDQEGRVSEKQKYVPGLPDQATNYLYDLQGRILYRSAESYYPDGTNNFTYWWHTYDNNGQLKQVTRNSKPVLEFNYTSTGLLQSKTYLKTDQNWNSSEFARQTYAYNIQDRLIDLEGSKSGNQVYLEELHYETVGSPPQFNGNVSYAVEKYTVSGTAQTYQLQYRYDNANRLIATYGGPYDEGFAYDASGRIVTKMESGKTYGPYAYQAGTNQVLKVPGALNRNGTSPNFIYDPNGNMVWDRSKKMRVIYDWRGLPVKFQFFVADIPLSSVDWLFVAGHTAAIRSEVEMMYDAAGNRVIKKTTQF